MISMMWGEMAIITPSLKCWAPGHSTITSKLKLVLWLGNCSLKFTRFRPSNFSSPTLVGTNCSIYQLMKSARKSGSRSGAYTGT